MELTPSEEARIHELEMLGYKERTNPELHTHVVGVKKERMSDAELWNRVKSGKPCKKAIETLKQRGYNIDISHANL